MFGGFKNRNRVGVKVFWSDQSESTGDFKQITKNINISKSEKLCVLSDGILGWNPRIPGWLLCEVLP